MKNFDRIRIESLYPAFAAKLEQLVLNCEARGQIFVATSGVRTYSEQDALYAKGRTAPGMKVTNARGGYSPHNFNVAVDFTKHDGRGTYGGKLKPIYESPGYRILGEEARKLGLEWGGDWKGTVVDEPHVQLPLKAKGVSWDMMREWYAAGGILRVFTELDARGPW